METDNINNYISTNSVNSETGLYYYSFSVKFNYIDEIQLKQINVPKKCNIAYLKHQICNDNNKIIDIIQPDHIILRVRNYGMLNDDSKTIQELAIDTPLVIWVDLYDDRVPLTCEPLAEPMGG
jgi:hypothetical protein